MRPAGGDYGRSLKRAAAARPTMVRRSNALIKPRCEPGCAGGELSGRGQDDLRPAPPYRADDLAGGSLSVHRDKRQAGAESDPAGCFAKSERTSDRIGYLPLARGSTPIS